MSKSEITLSHAHADIRHVDFCNICAVFRVHLATGVRYYP
jgi:hypothetical protein